MQKGKNTIAARVHFQRGTKSYHLNGRAGLLVQLDTDEKIIITNENWKVQNDLSLLQDQLKDKYGDVKVNLQTGKLENNIVE